MGGGDTNIASGITATVGGGVDNVANGPNSVIAGGFTNTANGNATTVGGGSTNRATGTGATVPGGVQNAATGSYSFAAGRRAKANFEGSFVWGDSTNADITDGSVNEFVVRASGGVAFYSTANLSAGVELGPGDGSWSSFCDRNAKENFEDVDVRAVLDRLCALPMTSWNYKAQAADIRHIGPMAQDFYAAFNMGADELRINTIDADGVALAAIQGLNQLVDEKNAEMAAIKLRMTGAEARNAELEARLARLEALLAQE